MAIPVALAGLAFPSTPASADSIRDREWHLTDLDIAQAHRITDGAGVTVALIDSGVYAAHPDLQGAVLSGADIRTGGEKDDGREDIDGHGTAMAGLIAGRGHGAGRGVLGIAPEAKVLPIAASTGTAGARVDMGKAVNFAIARRARVINMSWGTVDEPELRDALRKAMAADIVLVAAVGNRGKAYFPGRYDQVLTVGAYGRDGKAASFSVTGPQVDIAAPGVDIITTGHKGPHSYIKGQGTSEATAIVSGAAALLRAKFPDMSAAEVVHRLTATATDAGPPGRDNAYGYGRLNIVKALTADVKPVAAASTPANGAAPAPAGTSAVREDPTPRGTPLVLVALVAVGGLLLIGAVVFLFARRRSTAGS